MSDGAAVSPFFYLQVRGFFSVSAVPLSPCFPVAAGSMQIETGG